MTTKGAPVRDTTEVFWTARRAGMGERPRLPFSPFAIAAIALGLAFSALHSQWSHWRAGGPFMTRDTAIIVLAALAFVAILGFVIVRDVRLILRIRRTWRRAEFGEVRQVLEGVVLPQWQSVGNRPVRSVVAGVDGRERYVRLAFAREADAAALAPGPVQIELFDDSSIRGPARLRQPHGTALAFASRLGDFPPEKVEVIHEGGRLAEQAVRRLARRERVRRAW